MDFLENALDKAREVIDVACKKTNEVVITEKQKFDIASIENKRAKSKLITETILNLSEVKESNVIGIYMSFSSEVDTKDLIEQLLMLGKNIVIRQRILYNNPIFYFSTQLNCILKPDMIE